jgi:Tol biopolymer transport system component
VFTRPSICSQWADDPYYYYYYGYSYPCIDWIEGGLTVVTTAGDDSVRVTTNAADAGGTWHPDGESIAFTRDRRLYRGGPEGGGITLVPTPSGVTASDPSWSPDGATLAFTCEVEAGNRDVCSVRPDGSGFSRLTDDPARDARPDWSPDGSTIAFVTSRFAGVTELALMPSAGGAPVRVSPGTGATHPAWLDASTLVFAGVRCDAYSGCRPLGIFRVGVDGSGLMQLTAEAADKAPSWRP